MSEAFADEPMDDLGDLDGMEPEAEEAKAAPFDLMTAVTSQNLAFDLPDTTLALMAAKVCEEYDIDVASREAEGYGERVKQAVKLSKLAKEAKNYPWPNAANVKFPLIIQAAIQFNARAYPALVDGAEVVKGRVNGQSSDEKRDRARRVASHMSWQLLDEMEEWEEDTDALLLRLAIVGTLVRKTYFDPILGRNCSHVLGPDEFVVNYAAKRDLRVCPRATQVLSLYPHEVLERQRSGLWLDVDLGRPQSASNDDQAPHEFLEQHRLWDLDEDGYPEPYIVTVHRETQRVVRVVARWYEDGVQVNDRGEVISIKPYRCFTKYGFIPDPDGSFYDMGFGTLLGSLTETINSTLNQLMDAGHLANVQGGFIGDGVSLKSGNQTFRPGEWRKVQVTGQSLRDNIVPLPTKEPSNVLFSLLGMLIEASKDLTATQDVLSGDAGSANMPVGTTMALIEQGLKTFTAIVKRVHRALKRELEVMYDLNARYLDPEVYFNYQDEEQAVAQADYALGDIDVSPVSDPNMATDMQRMAQAQFTMQFMGAPGMNPKAIITRALEAARVPDIGELFAPDGPPPPDPKVIQAQSKAENDDKKVQIEAATAAADIAHKTVETEKLKMELALMGPEAMAYVENVARAAVQQALAMVENGGAPQVRPEDVRGMEGPSPDQGVLPVPGGPQVGGDGGVGQGSPYDAGPAGAEPPLPGAAEPGMG